MNNTKPNPDRDRLQDLQASGRVKADEAADLRDALSSHAERVATKDPSTELNTNRMNQTHLAFLSGKIDERALRAHTIKMTLVGGVLMSLGNFLAWSIVDRSLAWSTFRVVGSVGMGVTWTVLIHYFFLAKWQDKLIRLRNEAGALRPITIADAHQCPSCLSEDFKSYTPKNWMMRHWVWNPGLAFNEVVLGQRIPKLMRTCEACGGQSCPCPHCAQSIDLMTWSRGQAFGNWGGLRCPHCHGEIESLCNVFAWPFRAAGKLLSAPFRSGGSR
jgi:hypothetical protein